MVKAEPTNKNLAYLKLDERYVNQVLSRARKIVIERAQGSWVYDLNGDGYLDLTAGIAVHNIGHCHPRVVEAVQKQVAELMHLSVTAYHKRYIELAEKLAQIAPGDLNSVFLANSGAEAVEGALKMVRYVTGRPAVINFSGSFHGRTFMTTALTTSKLYYREKYEPLPGPIYTAPFPYVYRSCFRDDPRACLEDSLEKLNDILHTLVHHEQVGAFLIEPVLGEGGYVIPPAGFLQSLRQLANEYGILLVVDEVQTGFGRSGKMFACQYENVKPDVLVMAKALGGGLPLSAFIADKELTDMWLPGRHGSTFGGNPVSCAAALAAIDVIEKENLVERAAKTGKEMLEQLKDIAGRFDHVGDVRGLGMMLAIEFNDENGNPSNKIAEDFAQRCLENKLLIYSTSGNHGQVIRLMPPLNISEAEVEQALSIIQKSLPLK